MTDSNDQIRNEFYFKFKELNNDIQEIKERQQRFDERHQQYVDRQNDLEKKMIALQADISYIKKNQDALNKNLSTFLWLIGGGFITSLVAWVAKGGLFGG
jgi:predicted  nucleic acid-binding Zn-ribbon protein